jgi:uncharacterized protein (TIGR03435 family)
MQLEIGGKKMFRATVIAGSLVFLSAGYCQTSARLSFDAASVLPAKPSNDGPSITGGPGTKDPERVRYHYLTLKNLVMIAYDVKGFQVAGPGWIDTERFEISATMPPETTKEQFRTMLQNLLADRFQLAVHRETRKLPIYTLVVTKNGPKLKESTPVAATENDGEPAEPPAVPARPKIGADGFPVIAEKRVGLFTMMMPGRTRLTAQQQTMQDLANRLTTVLARPVTDETGLTAKYDFVLTFTLEGANTPGTMAPVASGGDTTNTYVPDGEAPQDLFTAIQSQLGLRLTSNTGPVSTVVIDHIERTPTGN